ncbi:kinase-like domain-containing protein [Globomyces pollinis-pini]|nr:kinase-like domain-containing protein [Globomyces pollinis-pini]
MADMDEKINEINAKLKKERMVLEGAVKLLGAQNGNPGLKSMVEMSIVESKQRIDFLDNELKKMSLKRLSEVSKGGGHHNESNVRASVATEKGASNNGIPEESDESRFSLLLNDGGVITSEKVKFRFNEISAKVDIESRVRNGSENMISALLRSGDNDAKRRQDLESQLAAAKIKEQLLVRAKNRYSQLYVPTDVSEEDPAALHDTNERRTGRLRMKLCEAIHITDRKSARDDIVATVAIDGVVKFTTRPSKSRWDEIVDVQVDRGLEIEIKVFERSGQLLALIWFKIKDLMEDLDVKYGKARTLSQDIAEYSVDLEPSGQLIIKPNFIPVTRAATGKDKIFRREAVQKIYFRNGHRYVARQFYQVMQCTICNEFLGRQGYQCTSCNNTVHPRCYERVITKCIPLEDMATAADKNTGQLLKYKIPHRWDLVTNLGASWCSHCGYILAPGKKMHRCAECAKCAHKECSPMVPCFCGLAPVMQDTLIAAFQEHEEKMIKKEMEEAENARGQTVVFEQADMNVLQAAIQTPTNVAPPSTTPRVSQISTPAHPPPPSSVPSQIVIPVRRESVSTATVPKSNSMAAMNDPALRKVTIDDFHLIAVLGRGAFGKVMLATEKSTNSLYAIKALKKEFIIQNDDVKSVKLEKYIFQAASAKHHPFMVNLHSAFDTATRLYFVMEYVAGGDLMCHIQEKKRFHQGRARFYACEVLTALQYFHSNNIVYRDLKLDNILLCSDGHIKVADYGICKANMPFGVTTATFCGTPDYMAPEILMNRKYGVGVDWWSFGVLIYVMLVGRYPFHGEDENDILEAILADAIEYPSNLPKVTLNLLQSLMHKNAARRLGAGRDDAEEVKRHPYFTGVDWDALLAKNCTPPFVPVIADAHDVSNFDKEFTSEPPVLTPMNSVLSEVDQKEFNDFGYIAEWALQARITSACQP